MVVLVILMVFDLKLLFLRTKNPLYVKNVKKTLFYCVVGDLFAQKFDFLE